MSRHSKLKQQTRLVEQWPLSPAATLGSAVRAKGILLEVRARLPAAERKLVDVESGVILLRVPEDGDDDFHDIVQAVSATLREIEALPVIPREVEDILTISSAERHRWLRDGRLQSAGTRTVKLRGRARKITFHVFEPRHIEDVLDRDMVSVWREPASRRGEGRAYTRWQTGPNCRLVVWYEAGWWSIPGTARLGGLRPRRLAALVLSRQRGVSCSGVY
jgi:hypothetical protein